MNFSPWGSGFYRKSFNHGKIYNRVLAVKPLLIHDFGCVTFFFEDLYFFFQSYNAAIALIPNYYLIFIVGVYTLLSNKIFIKLIDALILFYW